MKKTYAILVLILMLSGCRVRIDEDLNIPNSNEKVEELNDKNSQININADNNPFELKEENTLTEDGFSSYLMDVNFDDGVINESEIRINVEKELDCYVIERHYLEINGAGSNNLWGEIEIDLKFEYPQIGGIENKEIQKKINERIYMSFFYKKSLSEIVNKSLFESTNRIETGTYEIEYANNEILSISAQTDYSTGATPAKSLFGLTIAVDNGKLLSLSNLVDIDYLKNSISTNNFEIVGKEVGVGGSKATDQLIKESIIEFIVKKYTIIDTNESDDIAFTYEKNGFYIDGDFIYIYISSIESYGREFYLKIPFTIN